MGNDNSRIAEETKLPPMEVAWLEERYGVLTQRTTTTRDPVLLTEEQFVCKFPDSQRTMAKLLFDAMDSDRQGVVDFRHFCIAIAMLSNGTRDDKIAFAFRLYDYGHKGYIDSKDIRTVVNAFRISSERLARALTDETAEEAAASPSASSTEEAIAVRSTAEIAESLMAHMDPSGSGRVTQAEFAAFCRHHPEVVDQVHVAFQALRRAAMFDWTSPNARVSGKECVVC
jgi:Ca2+-binding EF-hand superfamily protein